VSNNSSFNQIRKIDNVPRGVPLITTITVGLLLIIAVWFFKGGSFRLYASLFFGLYFFTQSSWLSIILVSVIQNTFFLPFRIIGNRFHHDIKDFEHELSKAKNDKQSFLINKKVREGDLSIIFYILNFIFLAIAFISAGRIFLLEFYHTKIDTWFLFNFIPYPHYPLKGVTFYFPFVKILETMAIDWSVIFRIWGGIFLFLIILRLLWKPFKFILGGNAKILRLRISYNRLLLFLGGITGTLFVVSVIIMRNIPVSTEFIYLSADLSKQNTTFNIITAICTFFATMKMGYDHNSESAHEARYRKIPEEIVAKVFKNSMKITVRNSVLLSIFAYEVTHMMPCSHDLSVLTFEALYVLSPITFDLLAPKKQRKTNNETATE